MVKRKGAASVRKYLFGSIVFLLIFFSIFHLSETISRDSSVTVFVIDSQIDSSFIDSPLPRLQRQSSHGSRTAALIRSITGTEMIPLSVDNFLGDPSKEGYIDALEEVQKYQETHPEQKILVNISLGFSDRDFQADLIKDLSSQNLQIIAAAGNDNKEGGSYPAYFREVIAVAALENNKKMEESNYGDFIDISAPGTIEVNEYFNLPYNSFSRTIKSRGTSFAAPQVSALLAEVLSYNEDLSIKEAVEIIKNTASPIEDELYTERKLGAGKINIAQALAEASPLYYWGKITAFTSLAGAALLFLLGLWQKYSYAALIIFALAAAVLLLSWPFILIFYYQFGYWSIILTVTAVIILYSIYHYFTAVYIRKTKTIKALIHFSSRYSGKSLERVIDDIAEGINNKSGEEAEKLINYLIKKLRRCNSAEKAVYYLKIISRLKLPPFNLIISKLLYFNLKGDFVGREMAQSKRSSKIRAVISAEFLYYLYNSDYKVKKTAAEILENLKEPITLIPIKNILKQRDKFSDAHLLYFLLDILSAFKAEAADFSELLREIIEKSDDQWLKYHALKAYQSTAVNDQDYHHFLAEVRKKEKEPVILALKD
jgi:hypothetical protein